MSGESESADVLAVAEGQESIKNVTQPFSMKDVYNFDETGLFLAWTHRRHWHPNL